MGSHGRASLLAHIIDPNREVDPSYWQWNVTTKSGQTLAGVIASENATSVTLRNTAGDVEIKKEEIATRENTRRSLMPEGFEALGAESLRDILTFMVGDNQKFQVLDLRGAYTADSRRGLRREDERDETVTLHRFGDVTVAGVPFFVMDPARSVNGANLIALKGGPGTNSIADEFPKRVEVPGRGDSGSLHFLGGVGGWAWPVGGDAARGTPAMKVMVHFADGTSEEHVLKNGEYFADTFTRVGGADEHRCRRLHAPRPAALLRAEPEEEGGAVEDRAGELRHGYRAVHGCDYGRRRPGGGRLARITTPRRKLRRPHD